MSIASTCRRILTTAVLSLALSAPLVHSAVEQSVRASAAHASAFSLNGYWFNISQTGSIDHMQVSFIERLGNGEPSGSGSYAIDTVTRRVELGPNGKILAKVDLGIAHSPIVSAFVLAPVSITYQERPATITYTLTPDNSQLHVTIRTHLGFGFNDTTKTETLTRQGFTQP